MNRVANFFWPSSSLRTLFSVCESDARQKATLRWCCSASEWSKRPHSFSAIPSAFLPVPTKPQRKPRTALKPSASQRVSFASLVFDSDAMMSGSRFSSTEVRPLPFLANSPKKRRASDAILASMPPTRLSIPSDASPSDGAGGPGAFFFPNTRFILVLRYVCWSCCLSLRLIGDKDDRIVIQT